MNRLNHRPIPARRHNKVRATTALAAAALLGFASAARAQCPLTCGAASVYTSYFTPTSVATGDFNGDGLIDLAVANSSGSVWIFKGTPGGGHTSFASIPVGAGAYSVKAADLNLDGKLDLVTANRNDDNASVLLGIGDGHFQPAVNYPVGDGPLCVDLADFNGDSTLDIVIANDDGESVSVLLGNADGTFAPQIAYACGGRAGSVTTGDLNHDGHPDLVVSNPWMYRVSVLRGKPDGSFFPPSSYYAAGSPNGVTVADFDNDGHLDVVAALYTDGIAWMRGSGTGSLMPSVKSFPGGRPTSVVAADLNRDGKMDLAIANIQDESMVTAAGNGDGTFQPGQTYPVGFTSRSITVADLNRDNLPDVIVPSGNSNGTWVFMNNDPCFVDLNHNGLTDSADIASGSSLDCNADAIPDECQHLSHPASTGSTSLGFDGNAQFVEIPHSQANNPVSFTAEMWVKYDGALGEGNYQSPLTNRYSCCDFYDLRGFTFYKTPDDTWILMTGAADGGSWSVLSSPQVVPGQWTHLAASYDHDTDLTALYVNGVEVASATGFHYVPNPESPMRVGAGTTENPWADYAFHGQIDDVRIWDHARSAVEIAVAMNERLSGNEPGLNSLYQFDDATGDFAIDSAPAGGSDFGYLVNQPTWTMPTPCGSGGCPADFDGDGTVDFFDYDAFVTCFEGTFCPDGKTADFDGDGASDFFDYDAFVVAFETPC